MCKKFSRQFFESRLHLNLKSKIQRGPRRLIWVGLSVIASVLMVVGTVAQAQQPKKPPRIGFLAAVSPAAVSDRLEAFRQGLRELGYLEGKSFVIESRYAEGKLDRLPALANELVNLKVDLILTGGPAATRPAKMGTVTIPIVMAFDTDPVGNGFVASLARPGGNVTGLSALSPEISGKQLELLKEILPRLSRVAILASSVEPANAQLLGNTKLAAGAFGIKLQILDIRDSKDIETAFQAASTAHAEALLVLTSPFTFAHRTRVVDLAAKNRLPAMYWAAEFVVAGGLMTYSVSFADLYRRAAIYVDKILKGRKPADLPVEQPLKFEFIVNLRAAKLISLTIPPNVLVRADKVIR